VEDVCDRIEGVPGSRGGGMVISTDEAAKVARTSSSILSWSALHTSVVWP